MSQKDKSESYENELRRSLNLMQFLLEDMAINIKCGLWATSRIHSLIYFKWFVGCRIQAEIKWTASKCLDN